MSSENIRDTIATATELDELADKERGQQKKYAMRHAAALLRAWLSDGDDETSTGCTDD